MNNTVTLSDHEIVAMRELTYYLPAIAQALQIQNSDVAYKLTNWSTMLGDVLERIDQSGSSSSQMS